MRPLLFLAGLRRIGATQTAVLSLCEPLAATLLAAVMLSQLPALSQLLGAALLVGAGVAVQVVPGLSVPARRPQPLGHPRLDVSLGSDRRSSQRPKMKVESMSQDRQWFVDTLRRLGYTEAAEPRRRENCPTRFPWRSSRTFADRYGISRDEVMSQMGGSP